MCVNDVGVNISKMPFYICVSFFKAKKGEGKSIKDPINTNDAIDRTSRFKLFSDYHDCDQTHQQKTNNFVCFFCIFNNCYFIGMV